MSELINNVTLKRRQKLKEIILSLHDGTNFESAKAEFKKHFDKVTTEEITQMEQELLKEGITIADIQRLCDVHAAVFEGSISDIHKLGDYNSIPGHPINVFSDENRKIEELIENEINPYLDKKGRSNLLMLRVAYDRLKEIDKHYTRKEMLFFPKLEKVGITAPPKVMWGVDDEIREEIKEIINLFNLPNQDEDIIKDKIRHNTTKIIDMVFKEDNILMPMVIDHMTHFDWILVDSSSDEVGYFLEPPKTRWVKEDKEEEKIVPKEIKEGEVPFDAGSLSFLEANQILNTLPFDMTFIDKDGHVKYFTTGAERIFERPLTVIGRHVNMCHPPESVHVVEKIVNSFKSGKKDFEDFWIPLKDKFILIRYFAIRDKEGNYLGTLELSQNIKPLKELEGSKRILED